MFFHLKFLDKIFWSYWCRTKLVVEFSILGLEIKFDSKKTRCSQRFTVRINVLNMPANPQAAAVRVLFNWMTYSGRVPANIIAKVNGHTHTVPYPYPTNDTLAADGTSFGVSSWRTYPLTIPITELVAGTNVVEIGTDIQNDNTLVSNVNIVLVDVPGGVPVLPGSNNAYPTK